MSFKAFSELLKTHETIKKRWIEIRNVLAAEMDFRGAAAPLGDYAGIARASWITEEAEAKIRDILTGEQERIKAEADELMGLITKLDATAQEWIDAHGESRES